MINKLDTNKKYPDLSIIIPCFNEAMNISMLLNEFNEIVSKSNFFFEIIVVDGGSTDGTQKELIFFSRKLNKKNFTFIFNKERGGYGADILKGLGFAKGKLLSWTHADMQTDPKDVIKSLELYLKNDNEKMIVKGKRKNRKIIDFFFTFGMQIFVFLYLGIRLDDINAQPKTFSRKFYENYLKNKSPNDFSLDLFCLIQAKKYNYRILEMPVFFKDRVYGIPKGGGGFLTKIKLIIRTLKYIISLKGKKI